MRLLAGLTLLGSAGAMVETPVQRVVKLLQDMQTQLQKEAAGDAELYKGMDCYCKNNKKNKEKELLDAQTLEGNLEANIQAMTGKVGSTAAKINTLMDDVDTAEGALEALKTSHKAQLKDLNGEERELQKAVKSMQMALAVLRKEATGFLQLSEEAKVGLSTLIHSASRKAQILVGYEAPRLPAFLQATAEARFMNAMSPDYRPQMELRTATQLLNMALVSQSREDPAKGIPTEYAGIFKELEKFEGGLVKSHGDKQTEIKDTVSKFNTKKKETEDDIKRLQDDLTQTKKENAEAAAQLAEDKHNLQNTQAQIGTTTKFLADLQVECEDIDAKWAKRSQERQGEIQAIDETINILQSDENREKLVKGMAPSFLQMNQLMTHNEAKAIQAIDLLKKASKFSNISGRTGVELMQLVAQLKGSKELADAIESVKGEIKVLVSELLKQLKTEVTDKKTCEDTFKKLQKNQEKADADLQVAGFAIQAAEAVIKEKEAAIKKAVEKITETKKSMLTAGQEREAEHLAFTQMVIEQRETAVILQKAVGRLEQYYNSQQQTEFVQTAEPVKNMEFESYKRNQGASSVLTLLGKIISESGEMVKTGIADESSSQTTYETLMTDSKNAIVADEATIVAGNGEISSQLTEVDLQNGNKKDADGRLEMTGKKRVRTHKQCDFLLAQFEVRQTAIQSEIDSLNKATAILTGMQN